MRDNVHRHFLAVHDTLMMHRRAYRSNGWIRYRDELFKQPQGRLSYKVGKARVLISHGDISKWRAEAVVTPANQGLVGNANPSFWAFNGRKNVDGAVRAAAGGEVFHECASLPQLEPGVRCRVGEVFDRRATCTSSVCCRFIFPSLYCLLHHRLCRRRPVQCPVSGD
jgi:hypothetical protein